jgi:MFS family permease
VLVGAIALFSLGSLACGLATSLGMLIAARVLQGFGGGGLMTLSQALIGEVVPPRLRARNQGYFAIIFTLASVGGPVIGGVVVHNASWRWLFLVNLPLCLLAGRRLYSLRGDDVAHRATGRPDVAGLLLFASAICTSLFWLSSGGHHFAWASATSIALALGATVLWMVLLRVERRAERPFLPIDLIRRPAIRYAVLTVIGFASAMFAMVFYLPVYLQLALHSNPAQSGTDAAAAHARHRLRRCADRSADRLDRRPTDIPKFGLLLAAASLCAMALAPADKRDAGGARLHDRARSGQRDVGHADRDADRSRPGAPRGGRRYHLAGPHAGLCARGVGVRCADLRIDRRHSRRQALQDPQVASRSRRRFGSRF